MELGLSSGEAASSAAASPFASFLNETTTSTTHHHHRHRHQIINNKGLGLCMGLAVGLNATRDNQDDDNDNIAAGTRTRTLRTRSTSRSNGKADGADAEDADDEQDKRALPGADHQDRPPVQLNLLPLDPVLPRSNNKNHNHQAGFPWPPENGNSEAGSSGHLGLSVGGFDVNQLPASADEGDDGAAVSSPNSTVSSFQIDFSIYSGGGGSASNLNNKRDSEAAGLNEVENERASSRLSDEEENGMTRKKLRLSKEQSAFLEESFKEHNTLNPKQKLALAKELNLRPRQVEVWFQNRRARTKLKQTEVDCEYLKRCCETLTEENRRLQKELQELRALKTSHPYYMQLPATTLTMCPSCERVAATTTTTTSSGDPNAATSGAGASSKTSTTGFPFSNNNKPRFYPFSQSHHHLHQSAAS